MEYHQISESEINEWGRITSPLSLTDEKIKGIIKKSQLANQSKGRDAKL